MLRLAILAALFALVAGAGWAQSPCDSPLHWGQCREGQTDRSSQKPSANERGTAANPIVEDIVPAPDAKTKATQAAHDEHEKEAREWHLVLGTYAIALFTMFLFFGTAALAIYTWRLWRTTKGSADEALAASTRATKTLTRIERAYLTGGGDIENRGGRKHFRVDAANYGKTAAFLTNYEIRFAAKLAEVQEGPGQVYKPCKQTSSIFDDRIAPNN
jgi:hypothetical protein